MRAWIVSPYPIRPDAFLVWYWVLTSEEVLTVLLDPVMRLSPRNDKVAPPEKRCSDGFAGADDDEDVPGLGVDGGFCGASWPLAQQTQKTTDTLRATSVFKQSSHEMLDLTKSV